MALYVDIQFLWGISKNVNLKNTVEHEIHACPKYSEFGSFAS